MRNTTSRSVILVKVWERGIKGSDLEVVLHYKASFRSLASKKREEKNR